ncbi:3-keto-5-aminohexanoate cleavage protein [Alphaproteobacteria bacterium]|nr:3-keto-5-aminohexanoate cleavage protein [Alphaproteobacteria bacterium]
MTKPTIIMAAPNGARKQKSDHSALPVTINETVNASKACFEAGASILHAHVRDENGAHVLDAERYISLLDAMRNAVPEMLVQITTEAVGRYSPQEQADIVFAVKPDFVSVGFGEMTGDASKEAMGFARDFYHQAHAQNIHVQHILYSPENVAAFKQAVDDKVLPSGSAGRHHVLLVLGRYAADFQSDPEDLQHFISADLSSFASWSVCAFGYREFDVMQAAIAAGGHCRVGFENNLHLKDGTLAPDNAALIRQLAQNCTPATRAETLALFTH